MDGLPMVPVHVEQTSPAFGLHFGRGFNLRLPVELLRNLPSRQTPFYLECSNPRMFGLLLQQSATEIMSLDTY